MKERLIWLIISIAPLCVGWTNTLKTSTPAGTDDPREADDRMREKSAAFVERLDIDHYFEASATSTYDAADTGMHRYVTYQAPISTPATIAASQARTYTKDVSSVAELHWIDENEAEVQLTSGGYLYGNSLKADSVLTAAIADANVTNALMADDSIDSGQYVDGSIDTVHIADANVTAAKIANMTPTATISGYDNNSSGTSTFANGLILAWGTGTVSGNSTVTVAHGLTKCFRAFANISTNNTNDVFQLHVHSIGDTTFTVRSTGSYGGTFNWLAIGR